MKLHQARLFLRIVESGSISSAARDLDLSPSLATRSLAKLECEIGAILFRRTTRSLDLTDAGKLFLKWAETTVEGLDATLAQLNDLAKQPSGLIRFASPELLTTRFLPPLIAEISDRYPDLRLILLTIDNIHDLKEDQFDAAIHIGKRPGNPFIARKILDIEPLLCASPAYIEKHGSPATPDDLAKHRILSHTSYHDLTWIFERRGSRIHSRIVPYATTTTSILLHEMALQGIGIARLTRRIAHSDLKNGALVPVMPEFRCINNPGDNSAIWVIRPGRYLALRTRLFIDAVIEHLKKVG